MKEEIEAKSEVLEGWGISVALHLPTFRRPRADSGILLQSELGGPQLPHPARLSGSTERFKKGKMASGPFTLAQLAEAVGMTAEDVEVCLDDGLLPPPRRRLGRSGDTGFHQEHVKRLLVIRRCLEFGFSRQEIRRIADQSTLLTCREVYELTGVHVDRLRQDGKSDAATRLAVLRERCPKIGGRRDCPIVAAIHDDG